MRRAFEPSVKPADCIFCSIVGREVPASIVREDDATLAFMDIRPMVPGHVLVVPKMHAVVVEDLPPGAAGGVFEAAREISAALRRSGLKCEAVSFYLANGREAGQEVLHVHLHLIPRYRGDGFGLRVPSDYGRMPDRRELEDMAARIRGALARSGAG